MNALERATSVLERLHQDDDLHGALKESIGWAAIAQAEAAQRQADQLERIADYLEIILRDHVWKEPK